MRTGECDDRSGKAVASDLGDEYLYAVADSEYLAGDLLTFQKRRLARSGIDDNVAGVGKDLRHDGSHDLLAALLIFLYHIGALRLADALYYDLFCSLRTDSAEILGLDLSLNHASLVIAAADLARLLDRYLRIGVGDLGNNVAALVYLNVLLRGIDRDPHVAAALLPLVRAEESGLDPLKHIFLRYSPCLLKHIKRVKEFGIHYYYPSALLPSFHFLMIYL